LRDGHDDVLGEKQSRITPRVRDWKNGSTKQRDGHGMNDEQIRNMKAEA
jgi:hypothetical protein